MTIEPATDELIAEIEPIVWLPNTTAQWLNTYDGPAIGRKTVAYNRPIKVDKGGVGFYSGDDVAALIARIREQDEQIKSLMAPTEIREGLIEEVRAAQKFGADLLAELAERDATIKRMNEALARWEYVGCPDCHADCSAANPPVTMCIMQETIKARRAARAARKEPT